MIKFIANIIGKLIINPKNNNMPSELNYKFYDAHVMTYTIENILEISVFLERLEHGEIQFCGLPGRCQIYFGLPRGNLPCIKIRLWLRAVSVSPFHGRQHDGIWFLHDGWRLNHDVDWIHDGVCPNGDVDGGVLVNK